MRIFATWTFYLIFYIVLYWTVIYFSQFPNTFFWSEWLPVHNKSIHTSLSPWSGVFQVNNSHPYEAPPTIQVTVRCFFLVFKCGCKKFELVCLAVSKRIQCLLRCVEHVSSLRKLDHCRKCNNMVAQIGCVWIVRQLDSPTAQ